MINLSLDSLKGIILRGRRGGREGQILKLNRFILE